MDSMDEDLQFDELLVIDDLDIYDDSELRKVVAIVESLLGSPGKGLRVSVLTAEQWDLVMKRMVQKTLKRGAELYFHMIQDPRDQQHLLISPSAVQSINEGSRQIYQELIYASMRCIPTDLTVPLRRGTDDLLAKECSQRIGLDVCVRNYPLESTFMEALLNVMVADLGHTTVNWAVMIRRSPKRVLAALMKGKFYPYWKEKISNDFTITKSNNLDKMITAVPLPVNQDIFKLTQQIMIDYCQEKKNG
jgi:hypothetical protein